MPGGARWRRVCRMPWKREIRGLQCGFPVLLPEIDPLVIEVMKEKGIDLSGKRPKGLNDLPPVEMDYLVTMGCEETCPAVLAKKIIEWEIPDPKGKPIDEVRRIRDMLEAKVKMLLEEVES